MRIGFTYDLQTDPHDPWQGEYDPPATVEAITRALSEAGHAVVPLASAAALLRALAHRTAILPVDVVFNIAEGRRGRCRESWVPTLLDLMGVPYTGSGPAALALALDKLTTKQLCYAHGISTPRWLQVAPGARAPSSVSLRFPLIVKPRHEGSAMGIDADAVVHTEAALARRVQWALETFREPVLIEEFIVGGEATVCVIGNDPPEALPVIARPIEPRTGLAWHAVTASQPEATTATVSVALTTALEATLQRSAVEVFTLIGCRDLARVDFRITPTGDAFFLEINPLPNLSPSDCFGLMSEYLGMGYAGMIQQILAVAIARHAGAPTPPVPCRR